MKYLFPSQLKEPERACSWREGMFSIPVRERKPIANYMGQRKAIINCRTSVSFVSLILIFLISYVFDLLAASVFINGYNDLGIFGLLRKTIFASNVSAYGIYLFDKVNLINQKLWLSFRCLTWRTPDVAYFRVELPYSLSYEQYKRAVCETEVNCQKIQHTVNIRPKMDQDQAAVMQYLHVPITLSSNEDDSHFRRVHYSFHEICLEYCIVIIAIGCFFAISTSSKFLLRGGHSEWSWMHLKFTWCIPSQTVFPRLIRYTNWRKLRPLVGTNGERSHRSKGCFTNKGTLYHRDIVCPLVLPGPFSRDETIQ